MKVLSIPLLVSCWALPVSIYAQTSVFDEVKSQTEQQMSGTQDSPVIGGASGVQVVFTEDQSKAVLKFSSEIVSVPISRKDTSSTSRVSKGWDLTFSAPLEDSKKENKIATLDRLSSGVKASLKTSRGYTFDVSRKALPGIDPEERIEVTLAGIETAYRQCMSNNSDDEELCKRPDENEAEGYINDHAPEYYRDYMRFHAKHLWFTANASLGFDDYEFLNKTDLSKQVNQEMSYKAGVSATYSEIGKSTLFTVGADFESAFDEAEESLLCLEEMGEQKCITARGAAPTRNDNWLAYSEIRRIIDFNIVGIEQIGIAPRITHNFNKDLTGVSLPIFLIPSDGGLSSGLQFGWRSDTDKVSAGIFVGGTFDFLQ